MKEPFELTVRRHGPTVLRVCRAALGPGADSDDAWSETFLSALVAWPTLDDGANVEAWLVRIAQRKVIDVVRGRDRRPTPTAQTTEQPGDVTATAGAPADDTGVWSVVAALPERQRLAVAYHYLGGLPHAETAALTGTTPAAVRRAASDGVRALRAHYAAAARDEESHDD